MSAAKTNELAFDAEAFQDETLTLDGRTIEYRAWEGVSYCTSPLDPIQTLSVFAPLSYFSGASINGYSLRTAPIFFPNTVGGYMPGAADAPGCGRRFPTNSVFDALEHGYVVASAGVRGRTSGKASSEFFEGGAASEKGAPAAGTMCGRAPAFVVDQKAAIRYLRRNAALVPGDVERIFTNGTSAGGALSALTGASGNSADYEPYLERIGAVMDERDDVFGASCYCPIHNLEHADAAYEWQFSGIDDYHVTHFRRKDGGIVKVVEDGMMDDAQVAVSRDLASLFPAYVTALHLADDHGNELGLDENGRGSFLEWVKGWLVSSAQRELETHDSERRLACLVTEGAQVDGLDYLDVRDGRVVGLDWDAFVRATTRMKPAPSFDGLSLDKPENEEFGDEVVEARHFTAYSHEHSKVGGELADERVVAMMNPLTYIGRNDGCCSHWRVRHGSYDRDTSLAIPVILATTLANRGYDVDFALPWGLPHSGDYDLPELFAWIDGLCR
jgi:hypothetical protein